MIYYFFNFLLGKLYFFALSILHFLFKIFIEFRFLYLQTLQVYIYSNDILYI